MQYLSRIVSRNPASSYCSSASVLSKYLSEITPFGNPNPKHFTNSRGFSNESENSGGNLPWDNVKGGDGSGGGGFQWEDMGSSWSTGLTKSHFDGEAVGHQVTPSSASGGGGGGGGGPQTSSVSSNDPLSQQLKELQRQAEKAAKRQLDDEDVWDEKMQETSVLLRQITEPGARGSYLKDSEKAEMYRLHKENPQVYDVERLAKDFRIMRQRVVAILWLKELEEEEEKKLGEPLDDSVELLIDTFPE